MYVCGQFDPRIPSLGGHRCISEENHRGRHAYRDHGAFAAYLPRTRGYKVPEEMTMKPGEEPVAVMETEHVQGEDAPPAEKAPEKGWSPDSDDFLDIKGKAYLPARRRVQWMRGNPEAHPDWTIDTEIVHHVIGKRIGKDRVEGGYALIRANVFDAEGRLIATGIKSDYSENFADYIEKAETGAIARALAIAGYGTESALDLDEGVEEGRIADGPVARPVKTGPSKVPGVGRGGKTDTASVAQIRRVSELSRKLELGPLGLGAVIENTMGEKLPDMTEDATNQSLVISTFLSNRSADEVGALIEALEKADGAS